MVERVSFFAKQTMHVLLCVRKNTSSSESLCSDFPGARISPEPRPAVGHCDESSTMAADSTTAKLRDWVGRALELDELPFGPSVDLHFDEFVHTLREWLQTRGQQESVVASPELRARALSLAAEIPAHLSDTTFETDSWWATTVDSPATAMAPHPGESQTTSYQWVVGQDLVGLLLRSLGAPPGLFSRFESEGLAGPEGLYRMLFMPADTQDVADWIRELQLPGTFEAALMGWLRLAHQLAKSEYPTTPHAASSSAAAPSASVGNAAASAAADPTVGSRGTARTPAFLSGLRMSGVIALLQLALRGMTSSSNGRVTPLDTISAVPVRLPRAVFHLRLTADATATAQAQSEPNSSSEPASAGGADGKPAAGSGEGEVAARSRLEHALRALAPDADVRVDRLVPSRRFPASLASLASLAPTTTSSSSSSTAAASDNTETTTAAALTSSSSATAAAGKGSPPVEVETILLTCTCQPTPNGS